MNTNSKQVPRHRGLWITLVSLIAVSRVVACGGDGDQDLGEYHRRDRTRYRHHSTGHDRTGWDHGACHDGVGDHGTRHDCIAKHHTGCRYLQRGDLRGSDKPDMHVPQSRADLGATAGDIQTVVGGVVDDLGRVTPDDSEIAVDLHLYGIDVDPLLAAVQLANQGIEVSPMDIYAFAPGWQYSP